MAEPCNSTHYPMVFGETVTPAKRTANYHSLQYTFKPQSSKRSKAGSIHIDATTVTLQLSNSVEGQPNTLFEGQWTPAQEGVDCVAIFDGTKWRLELLQGLAVNIKHSATPGVPSLSAPQSPQVVPNTSTSEETGPQGPSRDMLDALQEEVEGEQKELSRTPEVRITSSTPSTSAQPSVTPSLSMQPSPGLSPSSHNTEKLDHAAPSSSLLPPTAGKGSADATNAAISHPTQQANNRLNVGQSRSSTSTDSDEDNSDAPTKPSEPQPKSPMPAASRIPEADMPDFEREFFQDNTDDESDSDSDASDSSGNRSEEEAKHF